MQRNYLTPDPAILYGTAWKKECTADFVCQALLAGFRGIDTACQPRHYNEKLVGEGIARAVSQGVKRAEIFVQTKFTPAGGQDPDNIPYDASAPVDEQVRQSFAVSQANLLSTTINSLVLHSPYARWQDLLTVWRAMEELAQAKQVDQLGISNCYDLDLFSKLYDASTVKPRVLQNRLYADTGYDVELRQFCLEHEIIYQSFWTLTANPHLLASQTMQDISRKHSVSPAQAFFRYLSLRGVQPLTGTTSATHMREDLAIVKIPLDAADCAAIDSLGPFVPTLTTP